MPFTNPSSTSPTPTTRLLRAHIKLARTLRDTHYGHHIREYVGTAPPSVVEFAKHVGNNTPFVVRDFAADVVGPSGPRSGGARGSTRGAEGNGERAVVVSEKGEEGEGKGKDSEHAKWSNKFLLDVMGDTPVNVAVTMDGRADAVVWLKGEGAGRDGGEQQGEDCSIASQKKGVRGHATDADADDKHNHTTAGQYVFATPYNADIPFSTALNYLLDTQRHLPIPTLSSPTSPTNTTIQPIIYHQSQNDCLRSEYPLLHRHLPSSLLLPPWITSVLGTSPEAINLWIGTRHSESTLHSDPYENMYIVLRGRKRFVLAPPGEGWFYGKEWVRTASWSLREDEEEKQDGSASAKGIPSVHLIPDASTSRIPWYPIPDPLSPPSSLFARSPRLAHRPKPYTVTVEARDLLYLPRGWLHHVEQEEDEEGLCVAVNSWFEGWDGGMGREWAWEGFVRGIDGIVGDGQGEDFEEADEDEDDW